MACDTGGTFTDLIVEDGNAVKMYKSSTIPSDPVQGVLNAISLAADEYNLSVEDFLKKATTFIHATTRSINAVLTGSTAKTAFLTTSGHKDILLFREGGRIQPFNFSVEFPAPFVPRSLTFEIEERIDNNGRVVKDLEISSIERALDGCMKNNVEAIGVCLLWSIANPKHEIVIGDLISSKLPNVPFTLSHKLNPTLREYRRAISSCLDASLKPLMFEYLNGLERRLKDAGFSGRVLMVTSQGGIMDAGDVAKAPIHSLGSGPAMAPIAGEHYAKKATSEKSVIIADTGGTSYDVSLVREGRIPWTRETWLGQRFRGHMTGFPSVDVKSIGAGGGSIAWVDSGGLLHVGPQSAGSSPGPVCYNSGGTEPTVTDCALALGFIDPSFFLGGAMKLDDEKAKAAIQDHVAGLLKISTEEAAQAVLALATEKMVGAIEEITVNQGIDPKSASLIGGGGAAGLNANAVARRLGCSKAIIPNVGAALSASGALMSDLSSEYAQISFSNGRNFDFKKINGVLKQLTEQCNNFRSGAGSDSASHKIEYFVEARYPQQIWEIDVPVAKGSFDSPDDVKDLMSSFHEVHEGIFEICDPDSDVEFVTWRAKISCQIRDKIIDTLHSGAENTSKNSTNRPVYFETSGWTETSVFSFESIDLAQIISGPAIVESSFTTVVIEPGSKAFRDETGSLVIEVLANVN
ncbi:MAG: hydantoinase/oxoprolinase family protein [Pseudomonadota bacterium]|nr:hydantoinase/oxoprolinase family protein [Pseudomonadota bacterium]